MKWMGKIGNNVEASVRINGILLSKPTKPCRCGAEVELSPIIEDQYGIKLTRSLKNIEDKLDWDKRWNVLSRKVVQGKISLDGFFAEQIKLMKQYKQRDWGVKDVSQGTNNAVCPKCGISLGELRTTLRIVDEPELMEFTKKQLAELKPSKEMLAYVSKRLNFGSVEELEAWLADKDADKAKAILQKTISEIEQLDLSYEASLITGDLRNKISKIDEETRLRKIELVNAVEIIVKERTPIIQ